MASAARSPLPLLLAAALIHYWVLARSLSAAIGGPLTTLLLIGGTTCGFWLGPRYASAKPKAS